MSSVYAALLSSILTVAHVNLGLKAKAILGAYSGVWVRTRYTDMYIYIYI